MSFPIVKICDVRSNEALQICKDCNVDLIGLHILNPTIKSEIVEQYKEIVCNAGSLKTVLLVQSIPIEYVVSLLEMIPFDYVQIHRPSCAQEVLLLKETVLSNTGRRIGVIAVFEAHDCDYTKVAEVSQCADFVLFDSHYRGGTGLRITDEDLRNIEKNCSGIKYFIAGGLTPENVKDVLRLAHPYGVDVQTGVESAKHVKDYDKIKKFVDIVRSS